MHDTNTRLINRLNRVEHAWTQFLQWMTSASIELSRPYGSLISEEGRPVYRFLGESVILEKRTVIENGDVFLEIEMSHPHVENEALARWYFAANRLFYSRPFMAESAIEIRADESSEQHYVLDAFSEAVLASSLFTPKVSAKPVEQFVGLMA